MWTTWLLASFLILPQPAGSCAGAPAAGWAAQPPEPGEPTPGPSPGPGEPTLEPEPTPELEPTPEPGEPIDPPALEEPPAVPDDPAMPTPDPAAPCCFNHPRYSGTCVVRPAGDETCASILAYLNDVRTVGKTYCDSTDIRGGWELTLCVSR
jgi:hypothetical protein